MIRNDSVFAHRGGVSDGIRIMSLWGWKSGFRIIIVSRGRAAKAEADLRTRPVGARMRMSQRQAGNSQLAAPGAGCAAPALASREKIG